MTSPIRFDPNDPRLTAYVLGELEGEERAAIEALVREDEQAAALVAERRETAATLSAELGSSEADTLTSSQRAAIDRAIAGAGGAKGRRPGRRRRFTRIAAVAASLLVVAAATVTYFATESREGAVAYQYRVFGAADPGELQELRARGYDGPGDPDRLRGLRALRSLAYAGPDDSGGGGDMGALGYLDDAEFDGLYMHTVEPNTESYDGVEEHPFTLTTTDARSTFSIDVDTASYANVRRYLFREGYRPPPAAVRIEELVNYFRYDYPAPEGDAPFSVTADVASSPWAPDRRLVRIGLRAPEIELGARQRANLVFLVDVSGSMDSPDKLPLLKRSMKLLVEQLDGRDTVAIVVYAGAAGLVLPPTPCDQAWVVMEALDRLQAGGSTNGGDGIQLAYRTARKAFLDQGINRVILCTDGDFNLGVTRRNDLVSMIESEREDGVYLSVLGFGTGNLKDSTMEQLADKGNGNYAYIDSLAEARKVLVSEMGGTLQAVAKDVKIQIEFNPAQVLAWRQIGYENRALAHQDFNDDTKDAGEIGAGHTVTALYEVLLHGTSAAPPGLDVDPSRYQTPPAPSGAFADELLFVRLRYKPIGEETSRVIECPVRDQHLTWNETGDDFRFAAAVAAFGMKLRGSAFLAGFRYDQILDLAAQSQGEDAEGYRRELLALVRAAEELDERGRDD